ncbi:Pol [Symbiodinium natans]|uniref:Pol protein n=1 Tax=Symbiodinium natans TaxID=878477 RepID=A0A812UHL8_9DINO|nr:Pol [Symbiodinium natans]
MTVSFHWVKAHAGTEGNEKADALANAGRTQGRNGGSNMVPPDTPPQDHTPTMSADTMVHAMKQAAADHFPYKERRAHTPWIKDHTLQLLAQARAAQAEGREDWKTQRNKAKRAARKDRIDWVHDQLLADPDASHSPLWNAVRRQKKGRFTLDDLQRAIQKSKGGKAPGPDQAFDSLDHTAMLEALRRYPTFDLEYADDTLLLALTTPQMQAILTSLESVFVAVFIVTQ